MSSEKLFFFALGDIESDDDGGMWQIKKRPPKLQKLHDFHPIINPPQTI